MSWILTKNESAQHLKSFSPAQASPYINRFLQPDSIIPNPANPQSLNRFGYVLDNPIRFNDPTGHVCSDPEDPSPSCENGPLPPNYPAPLPPSPVVITNPGPLDDGLVPEEPGGNGGGARGGGNEECRVPSCVDVPDFVTSPNPQFPGYQENQCLDLYIYNVCGSLTTDTVVDNGSFMISAPNQIMIGTFQTGQFGFAINNGMVMWLPAISFTNNANNATTFTRIGMQYSLMNTQRIAGQNVVSYRTGNMVNNIRTNLTLEYRPKNQLKIMAAWNLFGGFIVAPEVVGPIILRPCPNGLTC